MSIKPFLISTFVLFTFVIQAFAVPKVTTKVIVKKSSGYNIQTWKTKNKVPVYFVRRVQVPMVDIAVLFSAGSSEDRTQWGVASLTASMIDEGTKDKTATNIATAFDSIGAQYSSAVDRDMAVVSMRCLSQEKYLNYALKTFVEVLTQASFPEKAFVRVKQQTLDAIKQSQENPLSQAKKAFYKSVYGDQPYGHPTLGTLDSVNKLTKADISKFYQQYYVDKNAKLIIVGDLTKDQASIIADLISSQLPVGAPAPVLSVALQKTSDQKLFLPMPVTQNSLIIGELGITRHNPDYFNLMVANHVFGGLPMTSLLFEKVRNQKGLAYAVYSYFLPLAARGPFLIMLQTRYSKTQDAIQVIDNALKNYLKTGPTRRELEAAKLNLLGSFPIKLSTNNGILANVANIAFYNLPLDYLNTYPDKVKAVTTLSAKKAFAKTVKFKDLNTIIVGKAFKNEAKPKIQTKPSQDNRRRVAR
jgi:zinc protease